MHWPSTVDEFQSRVFRRRAVFLFLLVLVTSITSRLIPVDTWNLLLLSTILKMLAAILMFTACIVGLNGARGSRLLRGLIVGGLGVVLAHEVLYRVHRVFPSMSEWPVVGGPLAALDRISDWASPVAGAAVAMGFAVAIYELTQNRISLESQHEALRGEIERRETAERKNLDLTARVLELEKADSLADMAGGFSHTMNNLLTIVSGNAGLLLQNGGLNEEDRQCLLAIYRAGLQGAELAEKMRAFSGNTGGHRLPLSINAVVQDLCKESALELHPTAAMELHLCNESPIIMANEQSIRRALRGLLINAGEALDGKAGSIVVSSGTRNVAGQNGELVEHAYLEVRDTGVGMDETTRRRVFDPFFSTKFPGRGLGLAIVYGVAREHEGTVEVISAPGAGSTFTLSLPCRKPESLAIS